MNKKHILLLPFLALLCACGADDESRSKDLLNEVGQAEKITLSKEVINEMLYTLPKAIEVANILNSSNIPFSKDVLMPVDQCNNYPDKYHQAMGFGAFGVDLGYINLNDKGLYTLDYLESLSELSKSLQVDQFFDFSTLAEISKNRNNADSLLQISTKNFNKIDDYLKEQQRGEVSILMLIGSWIEGMHIFGAINAKSPGHELMNKIGEQKVVFENIYIILDKLKQIKHFNNLNADFETLKTSYDKVKITYEFQPPETKEVNGELVIIDKTKTLVDYTPEVINTVTKQIEDLRNKYLLTKIQ